MWRTIGIPAPSGKASREDGSGKLRRRRKVPTPQIDSVRGARSDKLSTTRRNGPATGPPRPSPVQDDKRRAEVMEAAMEERPGDHGADANAAAPEEKPAHLVITVHGIRTYGDWQSDLKHLLEAA